MGIILIYLSKAWLILREKTKIKIKTSQYKFILCEIEIFYFSHL